MLIGGYALMIDIHMEWILDKSIELTTLIACCTDAMIILFMFAI